MLQQLWENFCQELLILFIQAKIFTYKEDVVQFESIRHHFF